MSMSKKYASIYGECKNFLFKQFSSSPLPVMVIFHLFLAVQLCLEALSRCNSPNALRKAADSLPSNLEDMYRTTLERIKSQPEEDASVAIRALVWLVYAHRSLRIDELCHALAILPNDQTFNTDNATPAELIVEFCCGLIVIDKENHIVRLARGYHLA